MFGALIFYLAAAWLLTAVGPVAFMIILILALPIAIGNDMKKKSRR